jgi:hypothetical protein
MKIFLKLYNNDAEKVAILAGCPFCQQPLTTFQQYVRCWLSASADLGITKLLSKRTITQLQPIKRAKNKPSVFPPLYLISNYSTNYSIG